jgi:hypothetical protein
VNPLLAAVIWSGSMRARALRLLLLLVAFSSAIFSTTNPYTLEVTVGMRAPPKTTAQVFYAFKAEVFLPENNRVMNRHEENGGSIFRIRLYSNRPINTLRLDPSRAPGELAWQFLELKGNSSSRRFEGAELGSVARSYDQLTLLPGTGNSLRLLATSDDPKIVIPVPEALMERWKNSLTVLGWGALCAGLVEFLLVLWRPRRPFRQRVEAGLDRVVNALSEDATIRFSRASLWVLMLLLVFASVWIGLKLNQSSVGIWDSMYPAEQMDRRVDLGVPKAIRSDEWSVFTPWTLSQVATGMGKDNPNMGAPGSPILTGAPVGGLMMVAQPKYWGFLFFDLERGFSWMWAFKSFGLITAFFLLMLAVTKGDTLVSLATALGVYGSSYMQWWYSSIEPEVVTGFSIAVLGCIYLLQAKKTGGMIWGALLVALAVPNLLLHLYPPYLVPLAYLSVFLLVGYLGNRAGLHRFLQGIHRRSLFMVLVLGIWVLFVARWYLDSRETIAVMMNTVYPGHRFSMAGDMSISDVFYGVFESWKVNENAIPFAPANPSEVSRVWLLFPLALLLIPIRAWKHPDFRLVAWLMGFCAVSLFWAVGPTLTPVRTAMAHAGWSMSPAVRGLLGMGLASTMLMGILVSGVARGDLVLNKWPTRWIAGAAFVSVMILGLVLQTRDPDFFILPRLLLGATAVAALVWAVHRGQRYMYVALTIAVALPTLHVNPLQSGLAPYLNKGIFLSAKRVGSAPGDLWAVYGDKHVAQGFKASGLRVLNGTHYAPRLDMIRVLDPQGAYAHVWNRYAHIGLVEGKFGLAPVFEIQFADAYDIKLDVCGKHIRAAGVTHVAYTKPPSEDERKCLTLIPTNDQSGVLLFRLNAS